MSLAVSWRRKMFRDGDAVRSTALYVSDGVSPLSIPPMLAREVKQFTGDRELNRVCAPRLTEVLPICGSGLSIYVQDCIAQTPSYRQRSGA